MPQADHKIRDIPFKKLLSLNKPDWHIVLIGVAAYAFIGVFLPTKAILFSEILRVSMCMRERVTFEVGRWLDD